MRYFNKKKKNFMNLIFLFLPFQHILCSPPLVNEHELFLHKSGEIF